MKDIVIELQRALLTNLRENNAQIDLLALLQASDRGRVRTIFVFHSLYQRLAQAAAIPSPIDMGPALVDPASNLWYWMKLIESQHMVQAASSRYIQSLPSSPRGTILPGGLSGSPPDMIGFLRQMQDRTSPSPVESRRSSKGSLGSFFGGRRRSSVEAYSPRVDSRSRIDSLGSGAGLWPMAEVPDHYMMVDQKQEGSSSLTSAYASGIQGYTDEARDPAARLRQPLRQEQVGNEMEDNFQEDQYSRLRQHKSILSAPVRHEMDYDDLAREMTENPWSVDAASGPLNIHWQRTSSPEPIPQLISPESASQTSRMHASRVDVLWEQQSIPAPASERRRPMDTSPETRGFTPQLHSEVTVRPDTHTDPPQRRSPAHGQSHPQSSPSQRHNPIPANTDTPPPTRTPLFRPKHTPSITSTNSNTSSASSVPSTHSIWPPSSENNYAGFCKGAWKLHSGLDGFKPHSEPTGFYGTQWKWRCTTCCFEMPLAPGSDRRAPKLDTQLFTHAATGIKYRWPFLAKSHMKCKRLPGAGRGPGPFGCIFCCRERGTVQGFEGLEEFLGHLGREHRFCGERTVLEMARCVVGRVAGAGEGFDVNIPPPRGGG